MSCNENGNIIMRLVENASGISKGYVDNAVRAEAEAREAADAGVKEYAAGLVSGEEAARKAADSAERAERMTADSQLQQGVDTNAANITANASALTSEAGTRASEDQRLEGVIEGHKQEADNRFNELAGSMAGGFEAVNATIASNLEAAKAYADSVASGALHFRGVVATKAQLPASPAVGDFYTVTAEDNEEYAWNGSQWYGIGKSVDVSAITNRISANESAILTEKNERESAMSAESAARAAADTSLNSKITGEISRAVAAEEKNAADIAKEVEDRASADTALEARVNAQISQKTSAEIAADFDEVRAKLNSIADTVESDFWIFAVTDANGNVTMGQTITGDIVSFSDIVAPTPTAEQATTQTMEG